MIKGCKREIILINGSESSLFENAYFVLRSDAAEGGVCHDDMVREANRIIEKSLPGGAQRIKREAILKKRLTSLAVFLCGFVTGGGILALISMLY